MAAEPARVALHDGEIRNEPHVEEHHRDGEVGAHREHVPLQRRLEVRPQEALIRIRQEPEEEPAASKVDERVHARAHDGDHRHRFRGTVETGAVLRAEQEQHRRDQRAGVRNTDPEDEVDDVERPAHRVLQTEQADSLPDQRGPGAQEQHREDGGEQPHQAPVHEARLLHRHDDVALDLETRDGRGMRGGGGCDGLMLHVPRPHSSSDRTRPGWCRALPKCARSADRAPTCGPRSSHPADCRTRWPCRGTPARTRW